MRLIDADALKANCDIMIGDTTIGKRDYVMFHEIDSAQTIEPKQGEWISVGAYEVCKDCREVKRFPHWKFCPNCGADMRGEDNE